jgi:ariadne-1
MGYKCKAVLNEGFVETFATDKEKTTQHTETDDRYLQNRMLSYVTNHHVIKYCPSIPHCGLAIRLNSDTESMSLSEVKCQCGHKFCFGCLQAPHQPATCEMIKKWMKQMREDNANLAWVEEMCKQCPGCGFPIGKIFYMPANMR